jgi:hypothetical protein
MKQESVKLLQKNLDTLTNTYDQFIANGKYNEALNVIKNLEMVIRQLQHLGVEDIIIKSEENTEYFSPWYNLLEYFVKTKQSQLITLDYSSIETQTKHRATGKTTAIVRLAHDYNIPILTSRKSESILLGRAKELNLTINPIKEQGLALYNNSKVLLIDENFKIDKQDYKDKIIIGFQMFK